MFICICVYTFVTMSWFLVILRSTTGPYGRTMLEVAYGEMLFSLHRGCMGVDSSGRVVGVSTWCRPCWTYPGQHQCGLTVYYFGFSYYTSIKYINDFQTYTLYKRTLVVSDLVLARRDSENVFDRPLSFHNKCLITTDNFFEF